MSRTKESEIELLRNAMLFSLTRQGWSNRKQVSQDAITAACDKSKLNTTKRLVESEALDRLNKFTNSVYNWCLDRAMTSEMRRGVYFVRRTMIEEFEGFLEEALRQLNDKFIPEVLAEYQACKDAARLPADQGGLGELYCETDYPTPDELRGMFNFQWSWLALSVPKELPEEVRTREIAKLRESFGNAQLEITYALREGFKALVDNAGNLLTGKKNGKSRRFTSATLESFGKFFETFHARNMTDDKELEALVEAARKTVAGIDLKNMADGKSAREQTAAQFTAITKSMEKLLVNKPSRKFNFD